MRSLENLLKKYEKDLATFTDLLESCNPNNVLKIKDLRYKVNCHRNMVNDLKSALTDVASTESKLNLADVGSSVSFAEWKRAMRKEQLYYPALKFQKIREDYLEHYWREGYTPTDACNDILTAT